LGIEQKGDVTAEDLLTGKRETITLQPDGLTRVKVPGWGGKILKILG
jgi:hypothetical protein